ncbi:unnamed protein product [Effrenium voratum]|nr:unnamed protein product [Effrenium voratum]
MAKSRRPAESWAWDAWDWGEWDWETWDEARWAPRTALGGKVVTPPGLEVKGRKGKNQGKGKRATEGKGEGRKGTEEKGKGRDSWQFRGIGGEIGSATVAPPLRGRQVREIPIGAKPEDYQKRAPAKAKKANKMNKEEV